MITEPSLDLRLLLTGVTRRAAHVYRYSSRPVHRKEGVAEHIFYASFYSLVIAKFLIQKGIFVDLGKVLERAVVHDLDEALTGDFLRPVKYGDPAIKEGLDRLSRRFLSEISAQFGVDLTNSWETAKDESLEGRILYLADLLCVVAYVHEEFLYGNRHLRVVFVEVRDYFLKISNGEVSGIMDTPLSSIVMQTLLLLEEDINAH